MHLKLLDNFLLNLAESYKSSFYRGRMFEHWLRFNFLLLARLSRLLVVLLAEAKEISTILVFVGVRLNLRRISIFFGLARLFA